MLENGQPRQFKWVKLTKLSPELYDSLNVYNIANMTFSGKPKYPFTFIINEQ